MLHSLIMMSSDMSGDRLQLQNMNNCHRFRATGIGPMMHLIRLFGAVFMLAGYTVRALEPCSFYKSEVGCTAAPGLPTHPMLS